MNDKAESPKIFKLLEDFLIAEKVMKSFETKKPTRIFEDKVRASYIHISTMLDKELDLICSGAPAIERNDDSGTSETTSGCL